jgi:hypothetical protein
MRISRNSKILGQSLRREIPTVNIGKTHEFLRYLSKAE